MSCFCDYLFAFTSPTYDGTRSSVTCLDSRLLHIVSLHPWPGLNPNPRLNLLNPRLKFNRGLVLLFEGKLTLTRGNQRIKFNPPTMEDKIGWDTDSSDHFNG